MVDLCQVGNVKEALAVHQRPADRVVGAAVSPPQLLRERTRIRMCRHRAENLAFAQHQRAMGDAAELVRFFQYRVEHRREVARRGIDDAEDLGGRGLLRQRLARLGDEPRIFHRDHRLSGEVLEQRYLLVRERTDLLTIYG